MTYGAMAAQGAVNSKVPGSSPGRSAQASSLNKTGEIVVTEPYSVGASYEGVQADGDCSANLLGNYSQQASTMAGKCLNSSSGRAAVL